MTVWGEFYDYLFDDRHEGDYIPLTSFEDDYVKQRIAQCEEFLDLLRPLIGALTNGTS